MNSWQNLFTTTFFAEITDETLKVAGQDKTLELALTRNGGGRLEQVCKETLIKELGKLFHKPVWQPKVRLICAVSARGLSLRRLTMPAAGEDARRRLLQLQIESEFPLPPAELAWGSASLEPAKAGTPSGLGAAAAAKGNHDEHVLVAAVRKDSLRDYVEVFAASGAVPTFVPAAVVRAVLCPKASGRVAQLEVGSKASELLLVEDGNPTQVTILPWGLAMDGASLSDSEAAASLAAALRNRPTPQVLYLSGIAPQLGVPALAGSAPLGVPALAGFAELLGQQLGVHCEMLQQDAKDTVGSAAIAGLAAAARQSRAVPRLSIDAETRSHRLGVVGPFPVKWAAAALVLVFLAAAFPYFEALLFKPVLARKLAAFKADRGRLRAIDSELEFLRYFKRMQPPYLDALYMISRAVPPGSRFDSVSMTRRGELSLRGTLKDPNQLADFRAKLLDTGLFSNVAVEEQNPSPDRQKLQVRMTAQWKPGQNTRDLAELNAAKEPERPKSAFAAFGPGMMPPGMMGGPMPPPSGPGPTFPAGAAGPGTTRFAPGGPPGIPPGATSLATNMPPGVTAPSPRPSGSAPQFGVPASAGEGSTSPPNFEGSPPPPPQP